MSTIIINIQLANKLIYLCTVPFSGRLGSEAAKLWRGYPTSTTHV